MKERYPATEGRKDIDASDTPPLDGVKLAEVDRFALWSGSEAPVWSTLSFLEAAQPAS